MHFAAEMYVQRASCKSPQTRWPLLPITAVTGDAAAAEIADKFEVALAPQFPLPPDAFQPDESEQWRRLFNHMRRIGIPLFLLMRLPARAKAILPKLRNRFAFAEMFFLTGNEIPSRTQCPDDQFCRLEPLLPAGAEFEAQTVLDTFRAAYRVHS